MSNKYRLSFNAFDRKEAYENPKKIIWLSVEGTTTEVKYFTLLNRYKEKAGINAAIKIESLRRKDTNSDPSSVLDLLDEYVMQRDQSTLKQISVLSDLENTVGIDKIETYLDDETKLNIEYRTIIKKAIELAKYDIEYHRFLEKMCTDDDIFAIVIDTEGRDNESRANIFEVIDNCINKEYHCFLSNPCFEFFLLLHTYNPIKEYEENSDNFIYNPVLSNKHTYVSKLLSSHNGHGKNFSEKIFINMYLENIPTALKNSKDWAHTLQDVQKNVCSNMIDFFELVSK